MIDILLEEILKKNTNEIVLTPLHKFEYVVDYSDKIASAKKVLESMGITEMKPLINSKNV